MPLQILNLNQGSKWEQLTAHQASRFKAGLLTTPRLVPLLTKNKLKFLSI